MKKTVCLALMLSSLIATTVSATLWGQTFGNIDDIEDEPGRLPSPMIDASPLPNFAAMSLENNERQNAFINYLLPLIKSHNKTLLERRELVKQLTKNGDVIGLCAIALEYRISCAQHASLMPSIHIQTISQDVLARLDILPSSLVIAQSALESAWGTSRIAVAGNNLFGLWCLRPDCADIPEQRPAYQIAQMHRFSSVSASINAYYRTLNTHPAYRLLRQQRAALRQQQQPVSGMGLVDALTDYAVVGKRYTDAIKQIIIDHNLQRFDP